MHRGEQETQQGSTAPMGWVQQLTVLKPVTDPQPHSIAWEGVKKQQ